MSKIITIQAAAIWNLTQNINLGYFWYQEVNEDWWVSVNYVLAVRTTDKEVESVSSHALGPQLSLCRGDQMISHILDTGHYPVTGMGEYTPCNT